MYYFLSFYFIQSLMNFIQTKFKYNKISHLKLLPYALNFIARSLVVESTPLSDSMSKFKSLLPIKLLKYDKIWRKKEEELYWISLMDIKWRDTFTFISFFALLNDHLPHKNKQFSSDFLEKHIMSFILSYNSFTSFFYNITREYVL